MLIESIWNATPLRVGLDYGKEVHRSRNLGKWSNVIGYEMGSLSAGVWNMAKASPVEDFKQD